MSLISNWKAANVALETLSHRRFDPEDYELAQKTDDDAAALVEEMIEIEKSLANIAGGSAELIVGKLDVALLLSRRMASLGEVDPAWLLVASAVADLGLYFSTVLAA